jgi:hypothetical protein
VICVRAVDKGVKERFGVRAVDKGVSDKSGVPLVCARGKRAVDKVLTARLEERRSKVEKRNSNVENRSERTQRSNVKAEIWS